MDKVTYFLQNPSYHAAINLPLDVPHCNIPHEYRLPKDLVKHSSTKVSLAHLIIYNGDLDMLRTFIGNFHPTQMLIQGQVDIPHITLAAYVGKLDIVEYLMSYGYSLARQTDGQNFMTHSSYDTIQYLIQNNPTMKLDQYSDSTHQKIMNAPDCDTMVLMLGTIKDLDMIAVEQKVDILIDVMVKDKTVILNFMDQLANSAEQLNRFMCELMTECGWFDDLTQYLSILSETVNMTVAFMTYVSSCPVDMQVVKQFVSKTINWSYAIMFVLQKCKDPDVCCYVMTQAMGDIDCLERMDRNIWKIYHSASDEIKEVIRYMGFNPFWVNGQYLFSNGELKYLEIQYLVEKKDCYNIDKFGKSLMHHCDVDLTSYRMLLSMGLSPEHIDNDGYRAIEYLDDIEDFMGFYMSQVEDTTLQQELLWVDNMAQLDHLLESGADANGYVDTGYYNFGKIYPLMTVKDERMAKMLIRRGADPTILPRMDHTIIPYGELAQMYLGKSKFTRIEIEESDSDDEMDQHVQQEMNMEVLQQVAEELTNDVINHALYKYAWINLADKLAQKQKLQEMQDLAQNHDWVSLDMSNEVSDPYGTDFTDFQNMVHKLTIKKKLDMLKQLKGSMSWDLCE